MRSYKKYIPFIPAIFFILGLEIFVRNQWIPSYILPSASEVFKVFIHDYQVLFEASFQTFLASAIGFISAGILGIMIGFSFSMSSLVRQAFYPYAIFFQTVPIIAIAPLLVIWFGFGMPTVIVSAMIVAIFPCIAATLSGMQGTPNELRDLFSLYRATKWQVLTKLEFPNSLPSIFTGLRISAGLAVIGAIVGEFIAGGGLGGLIDVSRTRQRVDIVFASIILASLIGWVFVSITQGLRHRILRHWQTEKAD